MYKKREERLLVGVGMDSTNRFVKMTPSSRFKKTFSLKIDDSYHAIIKSTALSCTQRLVSLGN